MNKNIFECVIVSINYSDFLAHTLPYNKSIFDRIIVVSDAKNVETKKVCEFWNVECISSDEVYEGDSKVPNKAIAINLGLDRLSKEGWVVQMDADIWLPPLTRHILQSYHLDEKGLYSMDRLMCNSYNDWMKFLYVRKKPIHEGWIYLHCDQFPMGTRLIQYHGEGYYPIGYFQLWSPSGSGIARYPIHKSGFDRTDVLHLKQWKREDRHLIPDLVCVHLANEEHKQGTNWQGRLTAPFGPDNEVKTEKTTNFLRKLWYSLIKVFR